MINIIIITHGEFANAILHSAQMITGPQKNIYEFCFGEDESIDNLKERVKELLINHKDEENIIFTDIKGGTPFNVAYILSKKFKFVLITGLNLPILLETFMLREECNSALQIKDKLSKLTKNLIEIIDL